MSDELPALPAELAQMLAAERGVPPPSDMIQTAILGDLRVTLARDSVAKRAFRRIKPQLGYIAAFALVVGSVLVAIRPRSPTDDLIHVQPLDSVPDTETHGPSRPSPRPAPLGSTSNTVPAPPSRSPVLMPPLVLPTIPPPPPPATPQDDAGSLRSDAAVARRDTSIEEDGLLSMARSALARHDPTTAFTVIRVHIARFPHGHLAEEREALAIRALVMGGHAAEANARARLFRNAYPGSLFLQTIDDAFGHNADPH